MENKINQVEIVESYYGGTLRLQSRYLYPPARPFFKVKPIDQLNSKEQRKRKRQQLKLEALIRDRKFLPLDPDIRSLLHNIHKRVLQKSSCEDQEIKNNVCSSPISTYLDFSCFDQLVPSQLSPNHTYMNSSSTPKVAIFQGECVVIPAQSKFAIIDVRAIKDMLGATQYNLIVMDPPWSNKSVRRSRNYESMEFNDLLSINIPSIADDNECILGIWVTNNPDCWRFVKRTLLPTWGFTFYDDWYWLKVCDNGDLVYPLESTHRLPSERLIISYRFSTRERELEWLARQISTNKVIISVPLRHSWKPPPEAFFPEENQKYSNKLEIFAREVRPNWISLGNEVLKFQGVKYFSPTILCEKQSYEDVKSRYL